MLMGVIEDGVLTAWIMMVWSTLVTRESMSVEM